MTPATKVTVLTGGSTPERDVALAGAAQVVAALREAGFEVRVVDTAHGLLDTADERRLLIPTVGRKPPDANALAQLRLLERRVALIELPALREADVAFLVLHGLQGEGGMMQTLLEAAGVTYTGSPPLGSMIAMDKDLAKRLMRAAGVPTPDWLTWPADPNEVRQLGTPFIVKPSKAGSTVGLSVVRELAELESAVACALAVDDEVLLEQFAPGRELTVGVLDDAALAVGEIIPSHEIFDYECKYTPGMTNEIFPADVPRDMAQLLRDYALRVHRSLKLHGFSRVDYRLDASGQPVCLEVNTLPGLTATSLLPQSAAAAGIAFPELCARIVRLALRRAGSRNKVMEAGELN